MAYRTFTRTWWKRNSEWPDGREPHLGRKRYSGHVFDTEDEARQFCQKVNSENDAGPMSRKMEFEETR